MKMKWILVATLVFLPKTTFALWAEPSCDPAVDPSTCNIAAPINVSNSTQTKAGGLTLNGPLTSNGAAVFAGSLTVNSTSTVTVYGSTSFFAPVILGGATTVQSSTNFTSTSSITMNGNADFVNRFSFTGNAFNFSLTPDSIDDSEVSNILTASKFALPGVAGTDAVDLNSAEVGGFLPSNKVIDNWVDEDGDTMTGTLNITPTGTHDGIALQNDSPSDTGTLLDITSNLTSSAVYPATIRSTGAAPVSLYVTNVGTGASGVLSTATGTSSTGLRGVGTLYGVYGASSSVSGGAGVFGSAQDVPGGLFQSSNVSGTALQAEIQSGITPTSQSIAIKGVGRNGYGGHFTSTGSTGIGVYVENLDNTAGSFKSANGKKAIYAESAGAGNVVEIKANDETTVGLKIDSADNGVALDVADGIIKAGTILGGHIYSADRALNNVYNSSSPLDRYSTINGNNNVAALLYDGSQLWVIEESRLAGGAAIIARYDARTGARIQEFTTTITGPVADQVVLDGAILTVYSSNTDAYYNYNTTTNTGSSSSLGTGVGTLAAARVGSYVYIGTSNSIRRRNMSTGVISTIVTGTGQIMDMELVGNNVYAVDNGGNMVRVISTASGTEIATIPTGSAPRSATYDGQYLWTANTTADSITRIDPDTRITKTYPVGNGIGTGPRDLTVAGNKVWIAYTNGYYSDFDIATTATGIVQRPLNVSVMLRATFDGSDVWFASQWVDAANVGALHRIHTGISYGNRVPYIQKGILLKSGSSVYCVYMNGATLTASTSTTNCL